MVDGSMVFTREEKWKEIKLGRIFTDNSLHRVHQNRTTINESLYISHLGKHDRFTDKMEPYLDKHKNLVFVCDGAKWIWNWIDGFYPNAVQILDYFHASEKLSNFGKEQFKNKAVFQQWFCEKQQGLKAGKVLEIIEEIQKLSTTTQKAAKSKKELLGYFKNNSKRMKYDEYIAKGYLIGSGAMEAAHRNVIQKRMKLSGQRWSINGAQNMANLRVCYKSNQEKYLINQIIRKAA